MRLDLGVVSSLIAWNYINRAHMLSLPAHVSRGHHSSGPMLLVRCRKGGFD